MGLKGTFGSWDESIHMPEEQRKRILSAEKATTTPLSVDKESLTGVFPGSGKSPYKTTLESCTCGDFIRRKLPCKHMYRLAMECGVFQGNVKQGINKNTLLLTQIHLEDAVAILEKLSEKSQRMVMDFLYKNLYGKKEEVFYVQDNLFPDILGSPLFKRVDAKPEDLLKAYTKDQIIAILQEKKLEGCRPNMRIATLIRWCVENISDIWSVFPAVHAVQFADDTQSSRRKLYTYLLRKYKWDEYFDGEKMIQFPHGSHGEDVTISASPSGISISGSPSTFWFPDDDVTRLLTKYNCNRCLNGFRPSQK